MIKFVAQKRGTDKITIGLALMPGDVGGLLNGVPDVIKLADMMLLTDADKARIDGIVIMFFRDMEEFRNAMTGAGITATEEPIVKPPAGVEQPEATKVETVMEEPTTKDKFKAPPIWKILLN